MKRPLIFLFTVVLAGAGCGQSPSVSSSIAPSPPSTPTIAASPTPPSSPLPAEQTAAAGQKPAPAEDSPDEKVIPWLWVYAPCNLQVNKEADRIVDLMQRAHRAGYTGIVLTDTKFGRLGDRPANYYDNLRRTAQAANDLGIEVIPIVGSFGYSNEMLQNDPNLAEGIAVRDCLFTVHDGQARVADAANLLPMGDFEQFKGNQPAGWDFVDGPGKSAFADLEVKHGGRSALRLENFQADNPAGNARMFKKVAVQPWHQYHLSLWLRTRDVSPVQDLKVAVIGDDGRELNYAFLGAKATEDWTQHHVVFNSLGNDHARVILGLWGGRSGTFWVDDVDLQAAAGINLLRREGCPVRVTSENSSTEYTEGKDFERWVDPRMGVVPYAGEYEVYHAEPPLVLTKGSSIREGQRLKVSFYHTQTIYEGAVSCCLMHDDVFKDFEDSARRLNDFFHPRKIFMSHDELRLADQCALCRGRGLTAGGLLADNARRCRKILQQVAPEAEVIDWNDMFDPYHNAVDQYYLVGSTLAKSWEGLDPEVIIANWNSGKAAESLRFFADQGHRQVLASYYDTDNVQADVDHWLKAAEGVRKVRGLMYTTWRNDYKDLEKFAEAVRRHP